MLRVARTKISTFLSADRQNEKPFTQYQSLVALVKKHLSPATASVFAQPILQDESDYVEWYSELQGQPEPLLSLPKTQQLKVKELLTERLSSITKLAEQLPLLEPGSADFQDNLQKAVQFPGDKAIYVINDQPVIIFWGITDRTSHSVLSPTSSIVDSEPPSLTTPVTKKPPRPLLRIGLLLLFIALLSGLFWFWFSKEPFNWQDVSPFVDEYQLLMDEVNAAENNCSVLESIYTNNARINRSEEKFVLVKKQIAAKLTNCEASIQLKKEIESAQGDCPKLTDLLNNNTYLQNPQKSFIELKGQLEKSVQQCVEFQQLKSAIDSAKDNCSALTKIQQDDPRMLQPEGPFISLKQQLTTYQKNCRKEQLPKVIEARFVPGFSAFIPETKERALEEIRKIGIYLSKHKDAAVLITLHTPVPGPEHIEHISIRNRSGLETTKDVLDARFKNVVDNLLGVPGVSKNQIKKDAYQYRKTKRIVKFKIIPR